MIFEHLKEDIIPKEKTNQAVNIDLFIYLFPQSQSL